MSSLSSLPSPRFTWAELATSSLAAAKAFYGDLFGWQFDEDTLPGGKTYITIRTADDHAVGSLYELDDDAGPKRPAPHWLAFLEVGDASAMVLKAASLGAQVELPVFPMEQYGQMAIVRDPAGARLGLLERGPQLVSDQANKSPEETLGSICWQELATAHAEEASSFYMDFCEWRAEFQSAGEGEYIAMTVEGDPVAGMVAMDQRWKRHPAHWLNYVEVANTQAAVKKAKALGAQELSPLIEIPETCVYAVLRDPQGAVFAVMQKS